MHCIRLTRTMMFRCLTLFPFCYFASSFHHFASLFIFCSFLLSLSGRCETTKWRMKISGRHNEQILILSWLWMSSLSGIELPLEIRHGTLSTKARKHNNATSRAISRWCVLYFKIVDMPPTHPAKYIRRGVLGRHYQGSRDRGAGFKVMAGD